MSESTQFPGRKTWTGAGGYRFLWWLEHPAANFGFLSEHVAVVYRAMGRLLPPGAEVHHVNEVKTDNRPQNLVVCESHGYHMLLHVRQRALNACGNANWRKCRYCQRYDDPSVMGSTKVFPNGAYHRACKALSERQRKQRAAA